MESIEEQKRQAILTHSAQAATFDARYGTVTEDPYRNCFNYSRYRLDQFVRRYLPTEGLARVLDVGCGTGHHIAELRQKKFDVYGVDGSAEMVGRARRLNPGVAIAQADVESLPFPSASFDIVISIEVLRYLPRLGPCLDEIARVLKPGGLCLATAISPFNLNAYWIINRLAIAVPVRRLTRLKQYFHTTQQLRRECERAGFLPLVVHGVYAGPLNWIERLTPSVVPRLLRRWQRIDTVLSDRPIIREFSNMFLVVARRAGG